MIHRRGCDQPPPTATPSRSIDGLTIHRCPECGAVQLVKGNAGAA